MQYLLENDRATVRIDTKGAGIVSIAKTVLFLFLNIN